MKSQTATKDTFPPILSLVVRALDDKKAEDVRVLRVSEQSSITDYLVLATGTSEPHLRALRIELEKVIDTAQVHIVGMDTRQESGWVVIDAFDVMIHVFTPDNRSKYSLENLWKDAEEMPLSVILAPEEKPKKPKKAKAPKAAGTAAKKRVAAPRKKKAAE
jgi:ribosome-associated protein